MATRRPTPKKADRKEAQEPLETTRTPPPELTPPVRWALIQPAVLALAQGVSPSCTPAMLAQALLGVTTPLRRLEAAFKLAQRAVVKDKHARAELKRLVGEWDALDEPTAVEPRTSAASCLCGPDASQPRGTPTSAQPEGLLDARGLGGLLQVVAGLYCPGSEEGERALDAVMRTAIEATVAHEMVQAAQGRGPAAAAHVLQSWMSQQPRTPQPAQLMQALSGPRPGMPQLPGLPAPPAFGGGIQFDKPALDEILKKLRNPEPFDRDYWIPRFWKYRDGVYLDWESLPFFRCVADARAKMRQRAAIAPPARPAVVTWATGVTEVRAMGACPGANVVVRGTGLKPAGAVVLVPTEQGCRPVVPSTWTDALIVFVLPANALTGVVGFGNAAYIAAYDAWANEQNRLADEIEAMPCLVPNLPVVSPFNECPPDIGTNSLTAGKPQIDSFKVNGEDNFALETGQTATLTWTVRNTTKVEISRVGNAGPMPAPGQSRITNPPGSALVLGPFNSNNPIECEYELRVEGPCGTATRAVKVQVSKRPNLRVESVEVTQGIQTTEHTVPLVAAKPTVVRVTVRNGLGDFGGGQVPNVQGRIRVLKDGGTRSPWYDLANNSGQPMAPNPGASITVKMFPLLQLNNDTLNFIIPTHQCVNPCRFEVEVRVAGYGTVGAFAGFDQALTYITSRTYTFQPRRPLDFRYGILTWNGTGAPTNQECISALLGALPYLPTPGANIAPLNRAAAGASAMDAASLSSAKSDLADDLYDERNCDTVFDWFVDIFDECPFDDKVLWAYLTQAGIGGNAAAIPSNTFISQLDPEVVAHELGHCFDQVHVNDGCGARGGDSLANWSGGVVFGVPFNNVLNSAIPTSGTGIAFELMGYCGPRWPSPKRWGRMWNYIGI